MHSYADSYDSLTDIHVLSSAALDLPTQPSQYAAHSIPSLSDYQSLWTAWDTATKSMIPREDLLSKPIKLRNALIFYLGHIPTFSGKWLLYAKKLGRVMINLGRYPFDPSAAKQTYRTEELSVDF